MRAAWLSLSGAERAHRALDRQAMAGELFMVSLRARNPGASESELLAQWSQHRYRDVAPDLLAKAVAAIRARGAIEPKSD